MSSHPHITSPPPQLPPININNMPYSPPASHAGSRPYSPYAPSPVGSFNSMTPAQVQYGLPPAAMGGYAVPSYAAPTSSSASRLAPGSGQGGYTSRGYHSPSPGISQNMVVPNAGMVNGGPSQNHMGIPQQYQHQQVNRPMSGAGVPVMKGTLRPGQEVKVGDNVVVVEKYLSEGGYAHVYLTHSSRPIGPNNLQTHCLKRIAFDESQTDMMADTKKEIEVMKILSAPGGGRDRTRGGSGAGEGREENGSRWIVEYLGSEMRRTEGRNGKGWEVFILMEFCAGGGILDLLNKRLRDRLKEREILDIFVDICEAVAHMHSLPRPLLHRDLKIENILCHPRSSSTGTASSSISDFQFKLCDFGSTTYPAERPPRSKKEADELAYDLNRHTTLQYRSPEMVEPLLGLPVGLPADVWALGVLLYKLCYYTTPFEEHGPLAIVNAKYTFPAFPVYSPLMQHLIAALLMEQPIRRPSVFDVLLKVHEMRGTRPNPKYENMPEPRTAPSRPLEQPMQGPARPTVATPAEAHAQMMASIQPQRRGRPGRGTETTPAVPAPAPTQIPAVAAALDAMKAAPVGQSSAPGGSGQNAFQMQLTGEGQPGRAEAKLPPIKGPVANFDMDFGDAFSPSQETVPSTRPSQPDLLDSIGEPVSTAKDLDQAFEPTGSKASAAPASFQNSTVPSGKRSSGFGDSFGFTGNFAQGSVPVNKSSSIQSKPPMPRTSSTLSTSASPVEASFEDRFPSIEALTSGEEREAEGLLHRAGLRQGSGLSGGERSPLLSSGLGTRPQYQGMSSFRASLTGEESSRNDSHKPSLAVDGRPMPRSNHVTGSAFTSESPSEDRPSFMRIGSTLIPSADDNASSGPEQGPVSSTSAKYGAIRLEDSPPPLHRQPSAPTRDLLTDDDSLQVKAGYLTMVPQQNGKSASGRGPPPTANKPRHLSSGMGKDAWPSVEVESPVSASSRPQPPVKPQALTQVRQDASLQEASPLLDFGEGDQTLTANAKDRNPGGSTTDRAKTPDTFASTAVSTSQSLQNLSPPAEDTSGQSRHSSSTERARPGPERRSSINDIVSRFERMSSPPRSPEQEVPATSMLSRSDSQRGPAKAPPQIASKPTTLKPSGSIGAGAGGSGGTSREGSSAQAAPVIKPVARYGRLPGVDQASSTSTTAAASGPPHTTSSDATASGSAQKESIKSRIAMWNQAGPPVAVSAGPPALKPKPATLGSGRRL